MDGFFGEIRMFGGDYAPHFWAFCDGTLLPIASNTALFSIIGITYGGDGRTTFALPDMRGRAPVHQGSGPGLSRRILGNKLGGESVIMSAANLAPHTHVAKGTVRATLVVGNESTSTDHNLSGASSDEQYTTAVNNVLMSKGNVQVDLADTGGSSAISIVDPTQTVTFIICITGNYPADDSE
ncbi:MAG: phage tail protein [Flavobacteriales bacterium]|nr:phage tail protein [Flavobacteriales bacterium]